jgi:exopolyphosphatase/guanosine-5'-triphosphate,3'-diphosphate pyrophosphatase
LEPLHGLPNRYGKILHAAAMLHDIGLFITYPQHHKHSYYLIKSSGPATFDPMELELIANVARYHRKAHPSLNHLPFGQLSSKQQDIVRKLAAILRIADALDFGHQSKVKNLDCKLAAPKRMVSIRLEGAQDFEDEIECASGKAGLMNEVYGIRTVFR